jgi:hypothetical protein
MFHWKWFVFRSFFLSFDFALYLFKIYRPQYNILVKMKKKRGLSSELAAFADIRVVVEK